MTDEKRRNQRNDSEDTETHSRTTGSDTTSGSDETEGSESLPTGEIKIKRVEGISTDRKEESVGDRVSPRPVKQSSIHDIVPPTQISLSRSREAVAKSVNPRPLSSPAVPTFRRHSIPFHRTVERAAGRTQSNSNQQSRSTNRGAVVEPKEVTVSRLVDHVEQESAPTSTLELAVRQGEHNLLDEIEEIDPIFDWNGGLPYHADRPICILHRADPDIPSFEFLQRCLRDAYAEYQGGEPSIKQAEFVANELRIPSVPGSIVTLDMTEDEWTPSLTDGRPAIEHRGVNIVPELDNQIDTLYGGGLGYLLINIPQSWDESLRLSGFSYRLIERLTSAAVPESEESDIERDQETGVLEKLQIAPITVAEPRVTDQETFDARLAQYYGFDSKPASSWETISQADTAHHTLLRSGRWTQVALTERQESGEESDRHYNWKGLLTEGLARGLRRASVGNEMTFGRFVQEELLSESYLTTEYQFESDGKAIIPDIYLAGKKSWVRDGLENFRIKAEDLPVAFEFETGFSEGAFQYRKVAESLDKYREVTSVASVALIIPPRLLYRGRQQAEMIRGLVNAEANQLDEVNVRFSVPVLDNGRCVGLRQAADIINVLYE